ATASRTITVTPPAGSLAVGTTVFAEGSGTRTAGPFDTSAGDLVVAFASSSGPATGGQSITISGGGLTWSRVTSANGMPGTAEIWQAWSPTAQTGISITSTMAATGTTTQSVTVVTFSGAGGVGASAGLSALSGAPSVSLTTTKAGSFLYAVGNDWDAPVARTLGANQALVHQWVDTGFSNTYWVQNRVGPVANAGTLVQLNDTAPTADRWNFAAVEIVAAGTGQTTPTITWAAPASITSGTALSGTQLNATASVPGTFVYTPPAGTVLPVGAAQSLSVTFTPTDTVSYTTATKSVLITVTAPSGTITAVTLLANLAAPQPPGTTITLTAAATGGTAPYQFKCWVLSGTGWTILQDWNAAASYAWTPTTTNPQGVVEVWMRSAGNSANAPEKWDDLTFAILPPLTVTANLTAPQLAGT